MCFLQLDMKRTTAISLLIIQLLSLNCSNGKSPSTKLTFPEDDTIRNIQIYLYPAFNNSSVILIKESSNTVEFEIDTTSEYNQGKPSPFSISLDSFRTNTLIDSFYSSSFLNSIKFGPERYGIMDGLSIHTVIERAHKIDTIESGNVYPKSLSISIISQVNYIRKNTADTVLKKYIDDLKSYFN